MKSDNKFEVIKKLPAGIFSLNFDDKDLEIEHKIWYDNGIKLDSVIIGSDTSLEHIYNFLNKARLHSLNHKQDKVTCRVMKKDIGGELSSLPKDLLIQ